MTTVTSRARLLLTTCLLGLVSIAPSIATAQVPTPESHFGFRMGSDGQLASAESIEQYFELVAARSDRVEIIDLGPTTEGHRTIAAIVSAPENIRNLDQIRVANQRLADPRTIPPDEARTLAANHKAVLAIGCSIHASEIGATQAAAELLHALATSTEPETLHVLQNVVVILIPLLNPDGHRRIVSWHHATRNTPYENAPLPWLYHKYAGHDINRDAFMMNLAESRNLARFFYTVWHPQVFLSMHQMDSSGPRMFVPPVADPINRNYDPRIWREAALLGSAMAFQLQRDGRTGVVSNVLYDYYWPGYEDSAPLGHNTVCLLTEVASASISGGTGTRTGEARVHKDLFDDRPRMNYPDPWRGDSWTFRDLIDYDLSAARGLLTAVAVYREQIVQTFYELGRSAIELGQRGGPFAFVIPPVQHDPHAVAKLEELLLQGGVEIHRAVEPFRADGESYPAGTDVILLAQPFRAYVKTLLERQDYATLGGSRDGTGMPRPYDVAGWTLPSQMGIDVRTIDRTFSPPPMTRLVAASVARARIRGDAKPNYYVVDARGNGGAIVINRLLAAGAKPSWISSELTIDGYTYARGSVVVEHSTTVRPMVERIATDLGMRVEAIRSKRPVGAQSIGATRVALYRPWQQDADEGWTRWLLEQYEFRFVSINDGDIRGGDLRKRYDAIILPSMPSGQLLSGSDLVPPQYAGGLGELGVAALRAFVEAGGTLICLNQAGVFAIDQFQLPVRDVVRESSPSDFFCPGSILRIDLDAAQPLSYGMNPRTAGFFSFSSAYDAISHDGTAGGRGSRASNAAARTVAKYAAEDVLVSGWLDGEHVIAGRSAAVEVGLGTGRIVLLGFATQHRGQSHATFRLLFNSIFTAG